MSIVSDVIADIEASERGRKMVETLIAEYSAACQRRDWAAVEDIRNRLMAAHEAVLDNIAAAYKRMEIG